MDVYINTDASTVGDEFNLVFKDIQVAGSIVVEGDAKDDVKSNYVVGQNVSVVGN